MATERSPTLYDDGALVIGYTIMTPASTAGARGVGVAVGAVECEFEGDTERVTVTEALDDGVTDEALTVESEAVGEAVTDADTDALAVEDCDNDE